MVGSSFQEDQITAKLVVVVETSPNWQEDGTVNEQINYDFLARGTEQRQQLWPWFLPQDLHICVGEATRDPGDG